MTAIDGQREIAELKRQIRQLGTQSGPVGGGGSEGDHAGAGFESLAVGISAAATTFWASAVGPFANATGVGSSAVGMEAQATANYTTAVGYFAEASGASSVAVGRNSVAQADGGVSVGDGAFTSETYTVALGSDAAVDASEGSALGTSAYVGTGHDRSTAVGASSATTASDQVMLGTSSQVVVVPGRLNVAQFTPSGSADSAGEVGDITSDTGFLYAKTSAGWKRAALSTF